MSLPLGVDESESHSSRSFAAFHCILSSCQTLDKILGRSEAYQGRFYEVAPRKRNSDEDRIFDSIVVVLRIHFIDVDER